MIGAEDIYLKRQTVDGEKGYFMNIDEGLSWTFLGNHSPGMYE